MKIRGGHWYSDGIVRFGTLHIHPNGIEVSLCQSLRRDIEVPASRSLPVNHYRVWQSSTAHVFGIKLQEESSFPVMAGNMALFDHSAGLNDLRQSEQAVNEVTGLEAFLSNLLKQS